jgi:hypothetical protein
MSVAGAWRTLYIPIVDNSTTEGETAMNRIDYTVRSGFLVATIGFATTGVAAPTDAANKTALVPATSPAAKAPSMARVVVTPSAEQMGRIRSQRRVIELESWASVGGKTAAGTRRIQARFDEGLAEPSGYARGCAHPPRTRPLKTAPTAWLPVVRARPEPNFRFNAPATAVACGY